MQKDASISEHIDAFNKVILDLTDINMKIIDEDKALKLVTRIL